MTFKGYIKLILILIILLFTLGCSPKSEEVEFYILPEYEKEIYSMLSSDEKGNHVHVEYFLPKRGGEMHLILCEICGEALGEGMHQPKNTYKQVAYRGDLRYHLKRYQCACRLIYAEEFFACLSDNIKCSCLEIGVGS